MIQQRVKYVSDADGKINEVILPIHMYREMVESLEDKELLKMMKEVESGAAGYLTEKESFEFIDSLIEKS